MANSFGISGLAIGCAYYRVNTNCNLRYNDCNNRCNRRCSRYTSLDAEATR